jgi:hypothetical protein
MIRFDKLNGVLFKTLRTLSFSIRELLKNILYNLDLNSLEKELLIKLKDFENNKNENIINLTRSDYLFSHVPMLCCNTEYRKNGKTLTERIIRHRAFDRKYRVIEERTRIPNIWFD